MYAIRSYYDPGASKNEVVEEVTKPLERVLANIPGIEDIYSVSYGGGRAVLNVNFYVGEDVDSAKITLDDRIRSNRITSYNVCYTKLLRLRDS